jgi:hypothetical protein
MTLFEVRSMAVGHATCRHLAREHKLRGVLTEGVANAHCCGSGQYRVMS